MESAVADAAGGVAAVGEQGAGVELVSQGTNESASAVAIDANEEVAMDGADASTAAAAAVVAQGSVGVNKTTAAIDANDEVPRMRRTGRKRKLSEKASVADENL